MTATRTSSDYTWTQPWGEEREVRCNYNELAVNLKQRGGRTLTVRFRLFNDGLGFRYEFPRQKGLQDFVIMDELTEFAFPTDAQTWSQPTNGVSYYESLYKRAPLSEKDTISTPFTMEVADDLYLAVHEANLTDYASLNVPPLSPRARLEETLAPARTGGKDTTSDQNGKEARVTTPPVRGAGGGAVWPH